MDKTHFLILPTGRTVPCHHCGEQADLVVVVDPSGAVCDHAKEAFDALDAFMQEYESFCQLVGMARPIL